MQEFTAANRDEIRAAFQKAGVSHETVATACKVSRAAISYWLKGEIDSPALDKAIPAFASALTVNQTA